MILLSVYASSAHAYTIEKCAVGAGCSFYIKCTNGNSGGKYNSKQDADADAKDLCASRGGFAEKSNKGFAAPAELSNSPEKNFVRKPLKSQNF